MCQEWWLKLEERKTKQTLRSWAGCPHCHGSVACSWITIKKSLSKRKANMGCHIQNQKCQRQVYTQARWVQEEMKRPEEESKGEKVSYITRHLQRGESTLTASEIPFQKNIHLKKISFLVVFAAVWVWKSAGSLCGWGVISHEAYLHRRGAECLQTTN